MRKKISALILMLTFMLTVLTGCMELQRGIKVKANGDVECYSVVYMTENDMKYVYDTPEKFYEALKDSIDDEFPIESFEKIQKSEGKKTWFGARASYVIDKDNVSEELDRMFSDYDVEYKTSGFLIRKIEVTMRSKGKSLTSMFTDLIKKPEKELTSYINQTTKNEFVIDVPYPIVSTNGSSSGKTATWDVSDLDSMGGGEISMTVSYMNLPVFFVFSGILLLIVVVLIVILIVRHKKKKSSVVQAEPVSSPEQVSSPEAISSPEPVSSPVPEENLKEVPQVSGLPAVGQLPNSENKE